MIQLTLTLKMITAQDYVTYSGLRSSGRSNSTYFWNDSWVQTFHREEFSEQTFLLVASIPARKTIWKIPIASDKLRWIKFLSERSPLHNSNKNKEQGRLALHHHCQRHFLASYECLILQVTCSVSSIFRFQFKSCFKIYCIFLDLFSHWKPHFISFCLNKDNEYTTIWSLFSIFLLYVKA